MTQEIYDRYRESGCSLIPTKKDKSPLLSTSWLNGFSFASFSGATYSGIICGGLSGGIECIDIDNHFGDAKDNLTAFISIPEVKAIYEKYSLPIQQSQNKGFHFVYRTSIIENNRKLALRYNNDFKRAEALFETKGGNGYFCAYPSVGYKVVKNDIFNIALITNEERNILINAAISFNEYQPVIRNYFESETGDRPGDVYNQSNDSIYEMKKLLEGIGWKQVDDYKWRRPDKTEGISATLGKVAPNVFYVFTSSAHPFEPMKSYTPFQVLGLIKFNGDFKEAAKSLTSSTNIVPKITTTKHIEPTELEKILLGSRIDTSKPIVKPPTILSIKEQHATSSRLIRLFTLGNFSCIIGKAKSRKTFLQSLLTAATLGVDDTGKFVSELPQSKRDVLYFDTEQGEFDCYNVISRIEKMSGNRNNLKGYSLRQYSPAERCQIIEYAFELWGNNVGLCIIDGVADLANAINDELEATRISTMFLRLTKIYNCHISTVIHQNKNDNFATGHLGSSIMKKAEILISVAKSKTENGISEVSCDYNRGVDFEPFEMEIDDNGIPKIKGAIKKPVKYQPALSIQSEEYKIPINKQFDAEEDYLSKFDNPPNF
jgi:hypothetical protein